MMYTVSAPMTSDRSPNAPPVRLGDTVWTFDVYSDMKVPMVAIKVYEDGEWDGMQVWTWGWA